MDLVEVLISESRYPEKAANLMKLSRGCVDSNENAEYSELIIKSWISRWDSSNMPIMEVKKAKSFLLWAMEASEKADMHARGRLERVKYQLEEVGKVEAHQLHQPVVGES